MKILGKIGTIQNIRFGIRNLLVNFFAKRDDLSAISTSVRNNSLIVNKDDIYHYIDNEYRIQNSFEITNNSIFSIRRVIVDNGEILVFGDYSESTRYMAFLKYDLNFNLLDEVKMNDNRFTVADVSVNNDDILIVGNKTNDTTIVLFHINRNNGNIISQYDIRYETGFDENNSSYVDANVGSVITTSSGSKYAPIVFNYVVSSSSSRNGDVTFAIYDYLNNNNIDVLMKPTDSQYSLLYSVYNKKFQQQGEYFGGCVSSRMGDIVNASIVFRRYVTYFVMKINQDDTYSFYSMVRRQVESDDTYYRGYISAIDENGATFGTVLMDGLPGTPYENYLYTILYIMPFGPHSSSNVSNSWIIEHENSGNRMSISNIVFNNGYVHLSSSNGNIVLNINEIIEKDSIDLGGGFTLYKTENSDAYNYAINNDSALNKIYPTAISVNSTNAAIITNGDMNALAGSLEGINFGGRGALVPEFDTAQVTIASNTTIDINKSDLSDR